MPPSPQPESQSKHNAGWGSALGIVIIVALLIVGGIYFFMTNEGGEPAPAIGAGNA